MSLIGFYQVDEIRFSYDFLLIVLQIKLSLMKKKIAWSPRKTRETLKLSK